ncbi:hypothetical protein P3472_11295 [Vibrio parahaemolyticus]|nr:hypothetical protein [Vibrio parahaemolyticus]
MTERIEIKGIDIDLRQDGVVRISSPSLVNGLIKDQAATLNLVDSELAPLDLSKLTFDNQGKVVIADQNFHDQLKAKLNALAKDELVKNVGCGGGC